MKRLVTFAMLLVCALPLWMTAAQDSAFPVTIEHKFGSTTLTEAPERVVVIGYSEQDAYFALGVAPVAVRYWYGDAPNAIFEWAQDEANGATPEVLNMPFGNLNYEAILALQPDVISAVVAGITEEEYNTLSQIAPTIAQSDEYIDFGVPWQEVTRIAGAVVGKSDEAEARISDVEAQFAAAREAHPAFDGKNIAVAYNYGEARTYGYYTDQDSRARFFTNLGFVVPAALNEAAGESFYADLSTERIDLLNQDVLVFLGLKFADGGRDAIEADPLIQQLAVYQEGRVVYVPEAYDDALQFSSILSLEYALEGIVPALAAALDGDSVAQAADVCGEEARLVEHALGELCVPLGVERVVALEWTQAENLLALGVQPVGMADIEGYNNWVKIPVSLDESVVDVGTRQEPNLESIAMLNPDLILAVSFRTGQNYDALSAIAPTLVFDPYPTDMTHYEEMLLTFERIAQAVDREEEAAEVVASMEAHFAAAREALAANGREGETFILSQTFISSDVPTFRLFTDNALATEVLAQMGMVNQWDDAPQQFGFSTVGFEAFADMPETNFFYIAQPDYRQTLVESALWNGTSFASADRAYWLGGDVWLFGGPLSMVALVDTVLASMNITLP